MKKFDFKSAAIGFIVGTIGITTVFAGIGIDSAVFSNSKITLNGKEIPLSNSLVSITKDGEKDAKLYMPVRELLENLGYSVNWDDKEKSVNLVFNDITYVNSKIGFSVEFPGDWANLYGIKENFTDYDSRGGAGIEVYQKASRDKDSRIGTLFFIERWYGDYTQEDPPVKAGMCNILFKTDEYTYTFRTPSDFQGYEKDEKISEEYIKIYSQVEEIQKTVKQVDIKE